MNKVIINARRNGYTTTQCGRTMTVGELIEFLEDFDEDAPIYLSHDRGYTYGSINEQDFEESESDDEE